MWLDHEGAIAQVQRFSVLSGWRDLDAAAVGELAKALMASVSTKSEASRVVDMLIRRKEFVPRPVEIHREAAEQEVHFEADAGCSHCRGSGYEIRDLLVTYTGGMNRGGFRCSRVEVIQFPEIADELRKKADGLHQNVYTAAAYCRCQYGQNLKQSRLAHEQKLRDTEAEAVARRESRERARRTA